MVLGAWAANAGLVSGGRASRATRILVRQRRWEHVSITLDRYGIEAPILQSCLPALFMKTKSLTVATSSGFAQIDGEPKEKLRNSYGKSRRNNTVGRKHDEKHRLMRNADLARNMKVYLRDEGRYLRGIKSRRTLLHKLGADNELGLHVLLPAVLHLFDSHLQLGKHGGDPFQKDSWASIVERFEKATFTKLYDDYECQMSHLLTYLARVKPRLSKRFAAALEKHLVATEHAFDPNERQKPIILIGLSFPKIGHYPSHEFWATFEPAMAVSISKLKPESISLTLQLVHAWASENRTRIWRPSENTAAALEVAVMNGLDHFPKTNTRHFWYALWKLDIHFSNASCQAIEEKATPTVAVSGNDMGPIGEIVSLAKFFQCSQYHPGEKFIEALKTSLYDSYRQWDKTLIQGSDSSSVGQGPKGPKYKGRGQSIEGNIYLRCFYGSLSTLAQFSPTSLNAEKADEIGDAVSMSCEIVEGWRLAEALQNLVQLGSAPSPEAINRMATDVLVRPHEDTNLRSLYLCLRSLNKLGFLLSDVPKLLSKSELTRFEDNIVQLFLTETDKQRGGPLHSTKGSRRGESLSMLIMFFARSGFRPSIVFLNHVQDLALEHCAAFSAKSLSTLMRSLDTLRVSPHYDLLSRYELIVLEESKEGTLGIEDFVYALRNFSKMGYRPQMSFWDSVEQLLIPAVTKLDVFQMESTVSSIGDLGWTPTFEFFSALEERVREESSQATLRGQQVSDLLFALARMNCSVPNSLVDLLSSLVACEADSLSNFHLIGTVFSLGALLGPELNQEQYRCFVEALEDRWAKLELEDLEKINLALYKIGVEADDPFVWKTAQAINMLNGHKDDNDQESLF